MCRSSLFPSLTISMVAFLLFLPLASTVVPSNITVLQENSTVRLQLAADRKGRVQFDNLMKFFEFFERLSYDETLNECPSRCPPSDESLTYFVQMEKPDSEFYPAQLYGGMVRSRIYNEKGFKYGMVNESTVEQVREAIIQGNSAMFRAFESSPRLKQLYAEDPNWQDGPFEIKGWRLEKKRRTCTLDRAAALTINGSFYAVAEVTNYPVDVFIPSGNREVINECINQHLNSSLLRYYHPYELNSNFNSINDLQTFISRTTMIFQEMGSIPLAWSRPFEFDTNPAIQEAYHKYLQIVDLALDAITLSNIAILAVPMLMNLVPGAILEDLKTWAIVLYIIFTDIFSCIPFIIKGIELLIVAKNEKSTFLVADRYGNMREGYIEIFTASCHELTDFHYRGKIFVTVGVIVVIFGVAVELLALHLVKRRKIKRITDVEGIFGMSFYLEKSELGIWRNDMSEEAEEMILAQGMRRYSEESLCIDKEPRVGQGEGRNEWKEWWIRKMI